MTETEASRAHGSVWGNRDFVLFWGGQAVSGLGTQVTNLALPLAALGTFHASAGDVGLLRFVELVPYLFCSLPFGVWVDRTRRRPVMMAANAARLVLLLAVPLLALAGVLSIGGLLAIAGVVGVCSVLFDVSWMSFVPTIVRRKEHLVDANQTLGVTQSTTDLAGPGLAGVLIGWLGPTQVLVLDAASYLVSLCSLAAIRADEPTPRRGESRAFGRELADGLRWVFRHRVLRALAIIAPFTNLSLTCIGTLFLLEAVTVRGLSAATVGAVFSVSAVGALLGALASKRLMRRVHLGRLYVGALALLYAAPLLLPLASGPGPVVIACYVASLLLCYGGSGLSNVIQLSIRQTVTPSAMMGRMSAAFRTLLFGGGSLGALAAGLLGQWLGVHRALWAVALASAALVVPIALSPIARLRSMPPDPEEDPS